VSQYGRLRISGWQGLALVLVLATALRLCELGARSFHGDEMLSVTIGSSKTMAEAQKLTKPSWHPPLHYAIPRLLYLAGARTEFQWRIAGALFGVVLAGVTFLIPLLWGSPRLSVPAGVLAAASPMGVLFSQTNRWHPVVAGLLAVGCLGLVIGLKRGRMWGWPLSAACFVLAFQTVYLGGVVAALLMLMALYGAYRERKALTGWLTAAVLSLALVVPWLRPAIHWSKPGEIFWEPVRGVLPGIGKAALLLQNLTVGPTILPWNWPIVIPAVLLLGYVAWCFIRSSDPQIARIRMPAVAFFLLCLPVMFLAPVTSSPRYWLILLVPVHIGIAGGLLSIPLRPVRIVSVAAMAALVLYGLTNLYTHRQYQYMELTDDWWGLARMVRLQAQPGDEVWSVMTPFSYYYGLDALNVFDWYYDRSQVQKRIEQTRPARVFLQYSPLSGWEVVSFSHIGELMGEELAKLGFERDWRAYYGRDPDAAAKRKYVRGRVFPQYRHVLELWVSKRR